MPVRNLPLVDGDDIVSYHKGLYEFPYGAMSVASFLSDNGVESFVVSLDCFISNRNTPLDESKKIISSLVDTHDDGNLYIGLSINYKIQESFSLAIIEWLNQKYNHINILIGGSHATIAHNLYMENNQIIKGEGEVESLRRIKYNFDIRHDRVIKNKHFSLSLTERINDIPKINFDLLHLPDKIKLCDFDFHIPASRGCVGACAFCTSSSIWSCGIRYKELEIIESEISHLVSHNIDIIDLVDDAISINMQRLREVSSITKNFSNVSFPVMTRIDLLTREVVDILASSNMISLYVGIESTQEKILKEMNKNININKDLQILEYAVDRGLNVGTFWMLGHPGATRDLDMRSIDGLSELLRKKFLNEVSLGIFLPIPFTKSFYHPHIKLLNVPCELWTGMQPVHRLEDESGNVLYHEDEMVYVRDQCLSLMEQYSIANNSIDTSIQ